MMIPIWRCLACGCYLVGEKEANEHHATERDEGGNPYPVPCGPHEIVGEAPDGLCDACRISRIGVQHLTCERCGRSDQCDPTCLCTAARRDDAELWSEEGGNEDV